MNPTPPTIDNSPLIKLFRMKSTYSYLNFLFKHILTRPLSPPNTWIYRFNAKYQPPSYYPATIRLQRVPLNQI